MSRPARLIWCLLALGLGACSTPGHRTNEPVAAAADSDIAPVPVPPPSPPALARPAPAAPTAVRPPSPGPPAAPTQAQTAEKWIPLYRWCRTEGLPAPTLVSRAPSATFALRSANGALLVRIGSVLSYWDGLEVQLGFAPQMVNGQPYLHVLDLQKTIQPLLAGWSGLRLGGTPVLVIDPGHGGENAGTTSVLGNHYEKEYTLDWARRLQKVLTDAGWQVFLTRSNDSDLALSNRVAVAAQRKADLFLSLHFNSAAPDHSQAGLETYCLTPAGMPSNLTRGGGDETLAAFPNNAFDLQNLWLAMRVQRALLQVNGHNDRGVRRARFPGVLRGQQRPAILVEGGYLSNPEEARRISDPGYRQRLAMAVAAALTEGARVASTAPLHELASTNREADSLVQRVDTVSPLPVSTRQTSEETSHSAEIP